MPETWPDQQRTLAQPISLKGVGLHSGETIHCRILPAEVDSGRIFIRADLSGSPAIPASHAALGRAFLATRLGLGEAQVQTVEHLLAALAMLSVSNCRIELDGSEVPILDGSALPFVEAILAAGIVAQPGTQPLARLRIPVTVWDKDAFVSAIPSPEARFTYGIDYADSPVRQQWRSWTPSAAGFVADIAPARTFTRERDIEPARQQNLIRGGSLDNAIVCSAEGWLTPLRFDDEPVRHKLIDLLGDLSLLGLRLQGHFLAYKAGHALHHQLARQLLDLDALQIVAPESLAL